MGTIQKQGIQNTIISYLGIIIGFVNLLVLQPFMLTGEELGLTRILFSSSVLLGTLFPMGLGGVTIKYFPIFRNKANGHNGYFTFLILISISGYLLFATGIYLLKGTILARYDSSPLFKEYFSYIFPMSLAIGLVSIINTYSFSLFKTTVPSFLNEVFIRLCTTIVVSLYFLKILSFEWFMRMFMAAFILHLILLIFYLSRVDKIFFKINSQFVKKLDLKTIIYYMFLMAFASIASMALRNIDVILIGSDLNKTASALNDIAVYTIAFTIGSIIEAPANALSKIADSKISDAFTRNDFKLIETVYFKSTRILMLVGGLLFVGVIINIHSLLSLLPPKYAEGEIVVVIISVSSFFNMATGINSSLIYYSDKYVYGTYLLIGLIITSVLLNILFIPRFGIEGAAVATGTALFLFNLFKFLFIKKTFKLQPFGRFAFAILFLVVVCLAINFLLPEAGNPFVNILYRSFIITAVYGLGTYLFKVVPEFHHYIPFINKNKTGSGNKEDIF